MSLCVLYHSKGPSNYYMHNLSIRTHIGQYNKEMPVSDVSLVCSSTTCAYTRTVSMSYYIVYTLGDSASLAINAVR